MQIRDIKEDSENIKETWDDPIIKSTGLWLIEGTTIVGQSIKEIASKVLAAPNLRDIGVDEDTIEAFSTEGDLTIIFKWIHENLKPLYTITENLDN